jgi:two-component system chemotaxis response regulator CheB
MMHAGRKIRVLIVDDSAIVRRILTDSLSENADLEVVGTAPDPYIARDKVLSLSPDVLTLDIEMPRMDGLTFLRKLMQFHPLPVVVISSLTQASCPMAMEALRCGAVEVLPKPGGPYSVGEMRQILPEKIRAAVSARLPVVGAKAPVQMSATVKERMPANAVVAIGASTGGVEAIETVLLGLPARMPPIVITQHIPPVFSRSFAERLNQRCQLQVKEAADGDEIRPDTVLIAPGNRHLMIRRTPAGYRAVIKDGPRVCYQRPSVDVLMMSVAEAAGRLATGVLLTGMGADGAQGMLMLKRAGAHTIAQDERSCAVFGMPREAIQLGAVDEVLPLDRISERLVRSLQQQSTACGAELTG